MSYEDEPTREATAAEAKALAHPVRIRILQALRSEAKTNKEIARSLGTTPGATLYHVKVLLDQDFVAMEDQRPGRRGAREIPYSATGKTRVLSFQGGSSSSAEVRDAILRSALDGYTALPSGNRFGETSFTLHLDPDRLSEFQRRFQELVADFAQDAPSPDTGKFGFFGAAYRHEE